MQPSAFDTARQAFEAGLAAQQAGQLDEAAAHYRASLAALPGRPSTLTNLGATLLAQGRPDEALPLLQQATEAAPTHAEAWAYLGEAWLAHSQPAQALQAYTRLLALPAIGSAAQPRAALRQAECLARLGRLEEAAVAADALVQRHADWGEAWLLAGSLRKDLGRFEAAAEALQQAQSLGGNADQAAYAGWLLAGLRGAHDAEAPPLPPPGYVEALFDGYAADFDRHLDELEYSAPELLLGGLVGRRYARALDLGCGTGLVGRVVRPLVDRLEGLDVSAAMLERARATGAYDGLHQAELLAHLQQRAAGSVDLVLAADVFIYVGALDAVFAAVRRVLAPGGVFAFSIEEAPSGIDFELRATARYAHSERHLGELAARHGLVAHAREARATLRLEQRQPVAGLVMWLAPAPGHFDRLSANGFS
jgi:predicted TPR repeat methyltransferase